MSKETSKTVFFDLDATLANYQGWEKHGDFPGSPRMDVVNAATRLKNAGYYIGIFSSRNTAVIKEWVKYYELDDLIDFVNESPFQPTNTSHKPVGLCYIDDRGVRYDGTNMGEICDDILQGRMEPWYKTAKTKYVRGEREIYQNEITGLIKSGEMICVVIDGEEIFAKVELAKDADQIDDWLDRALQAGLINDDDYWEYYPTDDEIMSSKYFSVFFVDENGEKVNSYAIHIDGCEGIIIVDDEDCNWEFYECEKVHS